MLQVLVGNRLHLAFKRQVDQTEAEAYAERNHMGFYEVSIKFLPSFQYWVMADPTHMLCYIETEI